MECITVETHVTRLARMRQNVMTSCRLMQEDCRREGGAWYAALLTLTFRDSADFSPRCISELLSHARKWFLRRGVRFRYSWVGELTKRGRLHYHVVLMLPKGLTLPKPDSRGWWSWGSSRIERARHAVAYIAKYASKGSGSASDFPKGARISGQGGLSATAADKRRWWLSPSWVRDQVSSSDRPFRNVGGGFVARATGLLLPSPYVVLGVANGFVRLGRIAQ